MSSQYDEKTIEAFTAPNACGKLRTLIIKKNGFGRFTWRLRYQDNPEIADREHQYTDSYFDTQARAKRSALRFIKNLAQ